MSRLHLVLAVLAPLAACSDATNASVDAPQARIDAPAGSADSAGGADAPATIDALGYTGGRLLNAFDGLPTVAMSSAMVSQVVTGKGPFDFAVLTAPLAATGMMGWQFSNPTGSSMDTEFRVQDGSLAGNMGRGVVSFGADAATDRALGGLPTSNQSPCFGLLLVNQTSGTLTQATIAYTGEQWRRGDVTTPDKLVFEYGVAASLDATGLTEDADLEFTAPVTAGTSVMLDGNAAASTKLVAKTVTGLAWAPGSVLVLRWTNAAGTGKDDGLAIDDFSFTAMP